METKHKGKYALVLWYADMNWSREDYIAVEKISVLEKHWVEGQDYELLCEGQPLRVLDKMKQLADRPSVRIRF